MIFVAVCDDEKGTCAELESILMELFSRMGLAYGIDVLYTGEELCNRMESGVHYDLVFLDIEFADNEMSGLDVGRLIRDTQNNDRVSIVFISWEMRYSMQLFEMRPLHFLIKPLEQKKIERVVNTHLRLAGLGAGELTYRIGHDLFKVPVRDIRYVESRDRKLVLHLQDGRKEEYYGALREVYQQQLQKHDFIYIHSAFVVNYEYITVLRYAEVTLLGGETLPVSQARRKEARQAYCSIMERRAP